MLLAVITKTKESSSKQCRYCGNMIDENQGLCYDCRKNNDKMYMLVHEGLARYKYDKVDIT